MSVIIRRIVLIFSISIIMVALTCEAQEFSVVKQDIKLMGCWFEITAVATTDSIARTAINKGVSEIARIEQLISSWDPSSQTSEVNKFAGIHPVKVGHDLYGLISRSKKISNLTNGAFDISFASMDDIWKFDGHEHPFPDSHVVQTAASKIQWLDVITNPEDSTVYLAVEGMKIGFGGIGKGYAANKAKQVMMATGGLVGGLVNASGDLTAWGESTEEKGWNIQITNPDLKDKPIAWLSLKDMAIVTSGDYEKFFTNDGNRYSHIIDPRSGYPTSGIKSVSIICPDTEIADALATSVIVLGEHEGLRLVNGLQNIECIIITGDNRVLISDNLKLNHY